MISACTPQEFQWLVDRTGAALALDSRGIKATDAQGRIQGMVIIERWYGETVLANVAIDSPARFRSLLSAAAEYVFVQCGRARVMGWISSSNPKSINLARRLGFREVHRIPDGLRRGVDIVLLEMKREECRWLNASRKKAA